MPRQSTPLSPPIARPARSLAAGLAPVALAAAALAAALAPATARALPPPCNAGTVFHDLDGDGVRDAGEPGLPGLRVSDGERIVLTDAEGRYALDWREGRSTFVIQPAGWQVPMNEHGLPALWRNQQYHGGPAVRHGGLPAGNPACHDFPLQRVPAADGPLEMLVFGDPQPSSLTEVGYFERAIVGPLAAELDAARAAGQPVPALGVSLGDIVDDTLELYPALRRVMATLRTPWIHVPGNHDLDFDAPDDWHSLDTFRRQMGPDTLAWEAPGARFIALDDVIWLPGQRPAYIGGLREDQFAFLAAYLGALQAEPDARDDLVVLMLHIPLFDAAPGRETFRRADRQRLFDLLAPFPNVLVLSAHSHAQRHVHHGADSGWTGTTPLHEFNVGATCGSYWTGPLDADGVPLSTMVDGTPIGHARLRVEPDGRYALRWVAARAPGEAMALDAPRVLRRGAYPAQALYANVWMGQDDTRVEARVWPLGDEAAAGEWVPMARIAGPDPGVLAENLRDRQADALRAIDPLSEAEPSPHLWRFALPTDLAAGEHVVEVRAFDRWQGEQRARATYTLVDQPEPAPRGAATLAGGARTDDATTRDGDR
jgi:hypothetical protein